MDWESLCGCTYRLNSLRLLQAHEAGVRNMVFTHNETWLVTSDAAGQVKYWKLNLELVKVCHP